MQPHAPAMMIGPLRASPFVIGLAGSLTVHAGLLTALHLVPRHSVQPAKASPVIEFALGKTVVITEAALRDVPFDLFEFGALPHPPVPRPTWLAAQRDEVVTEDIRPAAPPVPLAAELTLSPREGFLPSDISLLSRRSRVDSGQSDRAVPAEEAEFETPQAQPAATTSRDAQPPPRDPPGVQQAVAVVRLPAPRYPLSCRRLGHEGTVMLQVLVRADGSVGNIRVVRESPCEQLDAAAVETARTARFRPATQDGVPVDATVLIPFRFQLR